MDSLNDDQYCFVCGPENPHGLKLRFSYDEASGEARAAVNIPRHFQGWSNILHGGVLSMILDEAMAKAVGYRGLKGVTTELRVKFRQKALPETEYTATGRVREIKRRLALTEATVLDSESKPVATAEGTFFLV